MPSGYGFIVSEDGEQFFFHITAFKGDWEELKKNNPPTAVAGQEVLFKAVEHPRGPRATNVEVIDEDI